MNKAPVLISVYDRPVHFQQCIESLKRNRYASETHLFVAIDAPYKKEHQKNNDRVLEYAKKINGFKEVTLIIREKNFGLNKNLHKAREQLLSIYDTLIFSEDDNIFSEDFLPFVNKGLEAYKDREDIFSISGYQYPVVMPELNQKDVYMWSGFSAWGCATWKEKLDKIDFSDNTAFLKVREFLKDYQSIRKINAVADTYLPALLLMIKKNQIHGDIYVCMHQVLHNMYSVFPTVSRVRNMGRDGSGLNCGFNDYSIYAEQEIYEVQNDYQLPANITRDSKIDSVLKDYFKRDKKANIKNLVKLFLLNLGFIKFTK
ncbi:MAG TPA: hypothetical protein VIJ75_04500 [Hanamia sp.]